MKSTLLVTGLVALFALTFTAMTFPFHNVPQKVKDAFAEKFPNAENVKWERESATEFEVEFTLDGKKMEAEFKTDGTWKETETEIKAADLPQQVRSAIDKHIPGASIHEAEMLDLPEVGEAYEVEMKQGRSSKEMEVVFGPDGRVLNKGGDSQDDANEIDDEDDDQ